MVNAIRKTLEDVKQNGNEIKIFETWEGNNKIKGDA